MKKAFDDLDQIYAEIAELVEQFRDDPDRLDEVMKALGQAGEVLDILVDVFNKLENKPSAA